jgi:hypothetical protein
MSRKVVSFESHSSKMSQNITASTYLWDILMDVESILNSCCTESARSVCNIVPAVCQPFDVDIAQNLFCGTHHIFNTTFQTTDHESSDTFNDIVWGSCCSYGWAKAERKLQDLEIISEQLVRFANDHFQSSASVTAMSQLDLGCLALWLSWYPSFFLPREISETYAADSGGEIRWRWSTYKDNVVTGLLNVLGSQKHDPKCLSIAVACLSFVIQQHNASDSVLTDANISQLLRLGLSKAVYPTLDSSSSGSNSNPSVVPAHWELLFCRIGIRRLLLIQQVLNSDGAVNETFTFVSKWWDRLKVSVNSFLSPISLFFPLPFLYLCSPSFICSLRFSSSFITGCFLSLYVDLPFFLFFKRLSLVSTSLLLFTKILNHSLSCL